MRPPITFRPSTPATPPLREIEVLIISAEGLKNVKHVTKMRTYAVVYVDQNVDVAKTDVENHGGVNPTWNQVVKVKFPEGLPESDVMSALNVDIYAHGHVREKPVGSARVLLCDVLKGGDAAEPVDNPIQCLTLQEEDGDGAAASDGGAGSEHSSEAVIKNSSGTALRDCHGVTRIFVAMAAYTATAMHPDVKHFSQIKQVCTFAFVGKFFT
ncbi:hypothetical protein DCAR_0104172 [Daucus carota subsp. sativus]|uniref:C2 domain-containing protein n=1 Tax=Daucus carota subsp. sativus TaxID=79200 RepID=A0A166ILP0_DAUCS|nr:hypothetical protein DCAR_0104172 [Daucus carota subsp. sativus]